MYYIINVIFDKWQWYITWQCLSFIIIITWQCMIITISYLSRVSFAMRIITLEMFGAPRFLWDEAGVTFTSKGISHGSWLVKHQKLRSQNALKRQNSHSKNSHKKLPLWWSTVSTNCSKISKITMLMDQSWINQPSISSPSLGCEKISLETSLLKSWVPKGDEDNPMIYIIRLWKLMMPNI